MRISLSDISITSRLLEEMKGFGGLKVVLQLMSNDDSMEQPDPMPMPKGYGTVRSPHLLLQPGLVMLAPLVMVLTTLRGVVMVRFVSANANGTRKRRRITQ